MQIGNSIRLQNDIDPKQRLFKITSVADFIKCMSTLAYFARNRKRINVQVVSDKAFRFADIRVAYFAWLTEICANEAGKSVQEMHMAFKADHLLPLLCREDEEFANLVYQQTKDGVTNPVVVRLLSVADSSVTTPKIMSEYFNECQRAWERYKNEQAQEA